MLVYNEPNWNWTEYSPRENVLIILHLMQGIEYLYVCCCMLCLIVIWCNEYWWFSCQRHVHSPVTIPPLSQGGVQTREKMWRDKTWPGLDRTNNYIINSCNEHHDQETRTIKYRIGLVSSLWLILIWGQEMTERYDGVVSSKYHDHRKHNLGYDWNFLSKTK